VGREEERKIKYLGHISPRPKASAKLSETHRALRFTFGATIPTLNDRGYIVTGMGDARRSASSGGVKSGGLTLRIYPGAWHGLHIPG